MKLLKQAIRNVVGITPYIIKKRLPYITLEPVKLLLAYYIASETPRNIVQVGACDGNACDSLFPFLQTGKMRALLIEPIPGTHAQLVKNYAGIPNVSIVQAAISRIDGTITMYGVKPDSKWAPPEKSMLYASLNKRHLTSLGVPPEDVTETIVPSLSLQTLMSSHKLVDVDLLQIDTEGYDAEIVEMALKLPALPKAINFEKVHLSVGTLRALLDKLQQRGYLLVYDEWNILAMLKSAEEAMSVPKSI